MVHTFFDKKSLSGAITHADKYAIKGEIMINQQLAEELCRLILTKFEKWIVHLSFKDNNWVADLAGMQWISKYIKIFQILLCIIDIFI